MPLVLVLYYLGQFVRVAFVLSGTKLLLCLKMHTAHTTNPALHKWMNEWGHLYSALLCIVVHPKSFTIIWGGLSSTTTSVQHPLGSHSTTAPVRSPHTSYRWRGERVIQSIKWTLWLSKGAHLLLCPPWSFSHAVKQSYKSCMIAPLHATGGVH